jgi:hypothetical protein
VLDTNAFIASSQAGAVLFQMREYADRVERATHDPAVIALLERGEKADPAPELTALADGFDTVFVENTEGRLLAQGPTVAPHVLGLSFAFRDYFQGAVQLAASGRPGVYMARAFRSESNKVLAFALSAPVRGPHGELLGVVAATLSAKAAFGAIRLQEDLSGSGRITTALVGPRGKDRNDRKDPADAPARSDFTFLVHPGFLDVGAEYTLHRPGPAQLRDAFGPAAPAGSQFSLQYAPPLKVSDFRDPIAGLGGAWLAAFAPVGKTGFVVLVETPRTRLLRWSGVAGGALSAPAALALALALPLFAASTRRRRARVSQAPST